MRAVRVEKVRSGDRLLHEGRLVPVVAVEQGPGAMTTIYIDVDPADHLGIRPIGCFPGECLAVVAT